MFIGRNLKGIVPLGDLAKMEVGTVAIYELTSRERSSRAMRDVKAYATRFSGTMNCSLLNAFDTKGNPRYLLEIIVVKQGVVKQK